MTLEEVNKILETETFSKEFNKSGLINKVRLLKMRSLFSEYFKIPIHDMYSNTTYFRFFSLYINTNVKFDIEKIKLDILNNIPLIDICLKYFEPMEVIEEIKNNIKNDILILNSKFYISSELTEIFNITQSTISMHSVLSKIKIKNSRYGLYVGSDINNHIGPNLNINGSTTAKVGDTDIITITALAETLKVNASTLKDRIRRKVKIFGVELESIGNENRDIYIKKEDYDKIVENKKYYISIKESGIFTNDTSNKLKDRYLSYYSLYYNDEISLQHKYIKKEKVIKIKEIVKSNENSFCTYFDNLYNAIEKSKVKTYNLDKIIIALGSSGAKDTIIKNFKIDNNIITKYLTLRIMDFIRTTSSTRYKRSKRNTN